jgi:transposase-like protein
LNDGKDVADVCRELQVSEQTYYRWRKIRATRRTVGRVDRPSVHSVHVPEGVVQACSTKGYVCRFLPRRWSAGEVPIKR